MKIRIAGVMSMNMPTTIRMMFISRKMTYLLSETAISALLIAAGIPAYAMTKLIAEDAEIRNRMMPEVFAESSRIFINPFSVRFL